MILDVTDHIFVQAKAKVAGGVGKLAKKKKWSKGKVKDKAVHAVIFNQATYDRAMKEVPTWKLVSVSMIVERLKVNGSLARQLVSHLEKDNLIKRITRHSSQLIYSAFLHFLSFHFC